MLSREQATEQSPTTRMENKDKGGHPETRLYCTPDGKYTYSQLREVYGDQYPTIVKRCQRSTEGYSMSYTPGNEPKAPALVKRKKNDRLSAIFQQLDAKKKGRSR